jgi:hypothetical protein
VQGIVFRHNADFKEESVKKPFFTAAVLLFALGAVTSAAAQPYDIDLSKFPSSAAYQAHIQEFLPLYQYVAAWSPEWEAKIPKATVVAKLESLLKETKAFVAADTTGNPDLLLFQALLKSCLYNTDQPKYHDEIVNELSALKKKYPKDYRAYWMLANHDGSADLPFAAVREYNTIFTDMMTGKVVPSVMNDYLKVCFFMMMFSRCKMLMDSIARENKVSDPRTLFPIYAAVSNQLKDPPVKHDFPNDVVYLTQRREFESGFLNRVLGIWIPVKDGWRTAAYELSAEGFTSFNIVIPQKSASGKDISGEIGIVIQASPTEPFENSMNKALEKLGKKQEYKDWKGRYPATVYEYWDPASFPENGGGHGFLVFIKRPQPRVKGLAIEAPAIVPSDQGGGKVTTVVLNEGYTRFDGDIYYTFMLSSAQDAFESSKKEFFEFLDRVLLD